MTTVVNTPSGSSNDGSGTGLVVGILLVILIAILFIVFGLPYLRNRGTAAPTSGSANINVQLPTTGNTGGDTSGGTTGGQQY
jgi:hypothetical protein